MPGSTAVYQPTTVTYDKYEDGGYLAVLSQPRNSHRLVSYVLFIIGLIFLGVGLCLIVIGASNTNEIEKTSSAETDKTNEEVSPLGNVTDTNEDVNNTSNVSTIGEKLELQDEKEGTSELLIIGIVLFLLGIILLIVSLYMLGYCRWYVGRKDFKFQQQLKESHPHDHVSMGLDVTI